MGAKMLLMNMKRMKLLIYMLAASVALQLCGCSKERPSVGDDRTIALVPVVEKGSAVTRASLYDSEEEMRAVLLHVHAFDSGTSEASFDSDAKFSAEDIDESKHRWLFHDGSAYRDYYWPLGSSLDFFAYAPVSNGYVTVDASVNPPEFTATLPLENTGGTLNQENIKEFTYAYAYDRDKSGGPVPLVFHHPFAAVIFKVSQSQRDLTVKNIVVGGINNAGTCSLNPLHPEIPVWDTDGNLPGDLTLTVGKIIPGDVNFGGELCGPYLVIPHNNSGGNSKELSIECHWKGYDTDSDLEADDTKVLKGMITNDWEPGKIYIYTLDLGNSREEILFKVSVMPWKYVYEHEFEIE